MRQSASRPIACPKVIDFKPNSVGSSQFHSSITTVPPIVMNRAIPTIAAGMIHFSRFLMAYSSLFRKLVVKGLQPLAQMEHGVPLARQQGIDVDAALGRELLEAAPLELVGDEDVALLAGELVEREGELVEEHVAGVERFGPGVGRGEQILEPQQLAVLVLARGVAERLRLLLAEEVGDAVAGDAEQPAGHVLDRHQQ